MKTLHLLGHNSKWATDALLDNDVGDGLVFTAFSFERHGIWESTVVGKNPELRSSCMLDLQFFGSRDSTGGKLATYPFHPVAMKPSDQTVVGIQERVLNAIDFQLEKGLTDIIVPAVYRNSVEGIVGDLRFANKRIQKPNTDSGTPIKYFFTLILYRELFNNSGALEQLLVQLTDQSIRFSGYYIVAEFPPEFKKKIPIDFDYYGHLLKVLKTLRLQQLETILAYANWDSILFASLCDISAITMGTYENLRRFSLKRFTEESSGGPSKGWYFSEKLLNFIRAEQIQNLRNRKCLDLVANENNLFSDVILGPLYQWNNNKPEVHKNYLIAINRILKTVSEIIDPAAKAQYMIQKVESARNLYNVLETKFDVYLTEESGDYFLSTWFNILKQNTPK